MGVRAHGFPGGDMLQVIDAGDAPIQPAAHEPQTCDGIPGRGTDRGWLRFIFFSEATNPAGARVRTNLHEFLSIPSYAIKRGRCQASFFRLRMTDKKWQRAFIRYVRGIFPPVA